MRVTERERGTDWVMGLGVGWRNISAMRELAGELEIKKKIEEERREKRSRRERERRKCYLMREGERSAIIFFFLTFELQCTSKDRCAL